MWSASSATCDAVERILERRNRALLRDLHALRLALSAAPIPAELVPYRAALVALCAELQGEVSANLDGLAIGRPEILEDLLSNTEGAMRQVRLLSGVRASPVLRAAESDRLALQLLGWLHAQHRETADYPPAFGDGNCAILPFQYIAPLYYFPSLEQRGLLFLVLLLHEFGHFLYARHQPELDALVGELQRQVDVALLPSARRNDRHAAAEAARRQRIVDTWYRWAVEFFCDAVGFVLGGPAYLRAFAEYVCRLDPADYAHDPADPERGAHPVTALRVRFLTERAVAAGYAATAHAIQDEWRLVARALNVREDYRGYYDDTLAAPVAALVDDMLTEADPRAHTATEATGGGWEAGVDSPIRLLNWAWQVAESDPGGYPDWESRQIAAFLR